MCRLSRKLAMVGAVCCGLSFYVAGAQSAYSPKEVLPPAPKTAHVQVTEGPELEIARDNWAIIRWTSNNPGGSDDHFGVVHYGTTPTELSETAKSPIRLNRNHATTVFRVRVLGLAPKTTYYYTVDSAQATGASDGVKVDVQKFTTP